MMSIDNTTTAPPSVNPSTLRVRRHRERRREGLCSLTVEMSKAGIEDAIARGMLKPDYDAWNVLDAWYADHLSDVALEWLVNNKVIKREQRNDAIAILRSISDWLERAGAMRKTPSLKWPKHVTRYSNQFTNSEIQAGN
jgi:hypothetical protein